jgi:anti-sigma-K factor RskA
MLAGAHVEDLIPAYALDCLDEAELLQVAEHLSVCARCRQELRTYQELADQLPLALTQSSPPAVVKSKLMKQITTRPAARPLEPPASWWERLSTLLQRSAPGWALASLAVMLLLILSNLFLWRQVSQVRQSDLPIIALAGTDFAPQAAGTIVVSRDGQHGALVVDGLQPLDQSLQYQLWLIKAGQRTSGGVFSVDEHGYANLYVDSTQPLAGYDAFGVTIEPAGGSPAPTGQKVLGGEL